MSLNALLSQPASPARESSYLALVEPHLIQITRALLRNPANEDQMQDARLASLEALRAYDPTRSPYFLLTLTLYVRRALYRQRKTLVHIPEHQRLNLSRLNRLEERFLSEHERLPNEEEIAFWLSLKPAQVTALQQAQVTLWEQDDTDPLDVPCPADPYADTDRQIDIERAINALRDQDAQAADVVTLRYLNNPPLSIQCISEHLHIRYQKARKLLQIGQQFLRGNLIAYA